MFKKSSQFFLLLFLGGCLIILGVVVAKNNVSLASPEQTTGTISLLAPQSSTGEPSIRVGLYKATDPVKFVADFPYNVYAGGQAKGVLQSGQVATLSYQDSFYHFKSGVLNFSSDRPIRLVPDDLGDRFILPNYTRTLSGKGNKNFNVYRGIMEYKYPPRSNLPYVINELPLDLYTMGIAETSNSATTEYIKALSVAARSYAYYNIYNGEPRDKRVFDVYASTVDQLYLGYNSELDMPKVAAATESTYGEVITYNGVPVTAPYFARSNGQTKTWKTVWGGQDKPWLQSVECIYDQGKKKFGHGVGMSNQDASMHAKKDGWTYDQILKYYYTVVELEKIY